MKCFVLESDFSCKTRTGLAWGLGPDQRPWDFGEDADWRPDEDATYETGGNTWAAAGPLTDETKQRLAGLWALAGGAKMSLSDSNVLGAPGTSPRPDIIVSERFAAKMADLDNAAFEFTQHPNVWDRVGNCPPWDGDFYIATLLQLHPTLDLERSQLAPNERVQDKYKGAYVPTGSRSVVRATAVAGKSVWRDTYTRQVLCTRAIVDLLAELSIHEWKPWEIEVLDDLN